VLAEDRPEAAERYAHPLSVRTGSTAIQSAARTPRAVWSARAALAPVERWTGSVDSIVVHVPDEIGRRDERLCY
jgi:hypothetical protein